MRNKKIIVRPEAGLGDAVMLTGVLRSLEKALPDAELEVSVSKLQGVLLQGNLKEHTNLTDKGRIAKILDRKYIPAEGEMLLNLSGYLDGNAALTGAQTLTDSQIALAEIQLGQNGLDIQLERGTIPRIRFDNVPEYRDHIELGRAKLEQMRGEYKGKQIVWFGARTSGSENRMPQSFEPNKNFWGDLVDRLRDRVVFYELRGPSDDPICEGIEPRKGEIYHFATEAEIVKGTKAGVAVNGFHIEFAHALGKPNMVVVVGPTHPKSVVYKNSSGTMLTVPDADDPVVGCRACGMLGYANPESFAEKARVMQRRFSRFEFDVDTATAIRADDVSALNGSVPLCRKLNTGELRYDCWKTVTAESVATRLETLL